MQLSEGGESVREGNLICWLMGRMKRIEDEAHSGGDCVYIIYYKKQFSSLHTSTCSVVD